MEKRFFGRAYGQDVYEYTISDKDLTLSVMELGATVTALFAGGTQGTVSVKVPFTQ